MTVLRTHMQRQDALRLRLIPQKGEEDAAKKKE